MVVYCPTPSSKHVSPRVDDVKYSGGDGGGVFGMKVRMSLKKFQPWVEQKKLPDERLQVVL